MQEYAHPEVAARQFRCKLSSPAGAAASMPLPAPRAANDIDPLRVWFRFVRLHRRASNAVAAELKLIGLSIPQFDLLSTLTEQEGLSQQELAQRLYVTKGNVSGLLDRMVEAGLVERRSPPGDRRSNALFLTPRGRALAEPAFAMRRLNLRRPFNPSTGQTSIRSCAADHGPDAPPGHEWRPRVACRLMA